MMAVSLKPDDLLANLLDSLCDSFESLWRAGKAPRIEEFLAGVSGSEKVALLRELSAVEIEYRLSCSH